ncbi:MAG: hydrogenase subunit MbhD domain-containing protein [Candidatus Hadarchaeaceae archaeon]
MGLESLMQNALLVFLFVLCLIAIELRDLLYSVIVLAGASITLAVIFYMLQAPDIAITQAAVGAGVATVLFVIAISRTRRKE